MDFMDGHSPLSEAVRLRDSATMAMVEHALRRGDVMLAFQPVVQAADVSKPAFHEGLIRLHDQTGRVIPAKDFIETIETREEGRLLDCHALTLGLAQLAQQPNLRLSINMSARSIGYPAWEEALARGLRREATVGDRLILEITESSAMDMPDLVIDFMDRIHVKGVSFALDDFGSGYTAFRYFKDFLFDIVKIDGLFIRDIHCCPDNRVLTNALVSIAQQFEMFTVAECVETASDANYLISTGVDCLQGYLFGGPTLSVPSMASKPVPGKVAAAG